MYRIGPLRIDADHLTVYAGGAALAVGPRVVATLVALCEHPGEVVGKDDLIRRVWPDECVDESSLWQNVHLARRLLRARLSADGIENVRGRGYRLTAPVIVESAEPIARRRPFARVAVFAAALALIVAPAPPSRPPLAPTVSTEGARLDKLGRYYLGQRTPDAALRSVDLFRRETRVDARSALGYAGLAEAAYVLAMFFDDASSGRRFRGIAGTAARRAIALEPASAQAQTSYAATREYLHNRYGIADANFQAALAADPQYAPAHLRYGISLLVRGRVEAAIGELRHAAQLEPVSVINNVWLANALYVAREPRAAERYARVALDLRPDAVDVRQLLGMIYEQGRDYGKAETADRALSCCPLLSRAMLARAYASSGDTRRAHAELRAIMLTPQTDGEVWANVAFAQLALHERDAALRSLAHVRPVWAMERSLLALDPRLDSVRADARFAPWTRLRAESPRDQLDSVAERIGDERAPRPGQVVVVARGVARGAQTR